MLPRLPEVSTENLPFAEYDPMQSSTVAVSFSKSAMAPNRAGGVPGLGIMRLLHLSSNPGCLGTARRCCATGSASAVMGDTARRGRRI